MMFSPDSAIDGAVLDVILRKAEAIRKATGVSVPLPDERGPCHGRADGVDDAAPRRAPASWRSIFASVTDAKAMEARWRDAEENEKKSRARFAQNAMKPQEVAPEWQKVARRCSASPARCEALCRARDVALRRAA